MDSLEDQLHFIDLCPEKIKKSLKWYTTYDYERIMNVVREGEKLDTIALEHYNNVLQCFRDIPPIKKSLTVYRGQTFRDLSEKSIMISTSLSEEAAKDFMDYDRKCCMFVITIPAGVSVLPLMRLSKYPQEQEILLLIQGKINVISREGDKFYCVYEPKYSVPLSPKITQKKLSKSIDTQQMLSKIDIISEDEYFLIETLEDAKETLSQYFSETETLDLAAKILFEKIKSLRK